MTKRVMGADGMGAGGAHPRCGSAFAAHLRRQSDDYAHMVRELNIKGE